MRRFSSSTKATCVPFLMEYLRRSFEGMTSWPFVVTVETSVFIRTRAGRIRNKYTDDGNVSQVHLQLTFLASVRHPGEEHSPVRQAQGKGAGGMKAKRGEERFMAQVDKRRREISLCAGRPLRRSEAGRKSRPASFEMTGEAGRPASPTGGGRNSVVTDTRATEGRATESRPYKN